MGCIELRLGDSRYSVIGSYRSTMSSTKKSLELSVSGLYGEKLSGRSLTEYWSRSPSPSQLTIYSCELRSFRVDVKMRKTDLGRGSLLKRTGSVFIDSYDGQQSLISSEQFRQESGFALLKMGFFLSSFGAPNRIHQSISEQTEEWTFLDWAQIHKRRSIFPHTWLFSKTSDLILVFFLGLKFNGADRKLSIQLSIGKADTEPKHCWAYSCNTLGDW